ncbi:hypothetical protein [Cupriavidus basilensis]|uniref:hypothetical protein n=1 Tax=Cupriavidus basilensis TaxID=68895 RepID=UPI000750A8C4|nr:hypothetical protein [Cupriavidus basilensis]
MPKHTRQGITVEHTGADMFVTAHMPCETPLSVAAEKAAQLHALLSVASDYAASGGNNPAAELRGRLLSLAAGLAQETLVLSEMVAPDARQALP